MRACRFARWGSSKSRSPSVRPDVDLVAEQVVGDAVGAVAMDDDEPEARLIARSNDRRHPARRGGRRHRPFGLPRGQRLAGQTSPTVLAKEDVVPVRVSAPPALGHVEGVCKRRNPLVTGGPRSSNGHSRLLTIRERRGRHPSRGSINNNFRRNGQSIGSARGRRPRGVASPCWPAADRWSSGRSSPCGRIRSGRPTCSGPTTASSSTPTRIGPSPAPWSPRPGRSSAASACRRPWRRARSSSSRESTAATRSRASTTAAGRACRRASGASRSSSTSGGTSPGAATGASRTGVARRDFSQRGNRVRLDKWQPTFPHAEHLVFLGGGAAVRAAAAWELQPAALELEGEPGERAERRGRRG